MIESEKILCFSITDMQSSDRDKSVCEETPKMSLDNSTDEGIF